jgi:hypothetical protein
MEINDISDAPHTAEKEKPSRDERERELVNSSGHVQEMDRTFSVASICLMAVLTDNVSAILTALLHLPTSRANESKAWGAGSGSLVVSLCTFDINTIPHNMDRR